MSIFSLFNISASALTAERLRMNVIADNIANVDTIISDNGKPYRRKSVVFKEMVGNQLGVKVERIVEHDSFKKVYEPDNPYADKQGYVNYPDINIVKEMVDMISASRSYQANISLFNEAKNMYLKTLDILRS